MATTVKVSPDSAESTIKNKKVRLAVEDANMIFPSNLYPGRSLCLFFYDYEKVFPDEPGNYTPSHSIFLPLPTNLVDALNISYRDVELGAIGGELQSAITRLSSELEKTNLQDQGQVTQALKNSYDAITKDGNLAGGIQLAVRRGLSALPVAGEFIKTAVDLSTKTIPNPHLTYLFGGVQLRSHTFSWKFSPTSEEETKLLKRIIRDIKVNSLPTLEKQFLLTFPKVVKVFLFINGTEYTELFKIKPAVVESIELNYAGSGTPAFFADTGGPVEVDVTLRLKELEIFTREDIINTNNGTQGNAPVDYT